MSNINCIVCPSIDVAPSHTYVLDDRTYKMSYFAAPGWLAQRITIETSTSVLVIKFILGGPTSVKIWNTPDLESIAKHWNMRRQPFTYEIGESYLALAMKELRKAEQALHYVTITEVS